MVKKLPDKLVKSGLSWSNETELVKKYLNLTLSHITPVVPDNEEGITIGFVCDVLTRCNDGIRSGTSIKKKKNFLCCFRNYLSGRYYQTISFTPSTVIFPGDGHALFNSLLGLPHLFKGGF